jgi:hypothetical protein
MSENNYMPTWIDKDGNRVTELESHLRTIAKLKKALEIYANKDNWVEDTDSFEMNSDGKFPVRVFIPDEEDDSALIWETYGGILAKMALED